MGFRFGPLLEFWRGSGTFDFRVLAGAGWLTGCDFQLTLGSGLDDKKKDSASLRWSLADLTTCTEGQEWSRAFSRYLFKVGPKLAAG